MHSIAPYPHPLSHTFDPPNPFPPPISIYFYVLRKLGILYFPILMTYFKLASLMRNQNPRVRSPFNAEHAAVPVVQVSYRTYVASLFRWLVHAD